MKPIEELAKECGGYIETGENDEHLEALCKAYMQDRLNRLKPVAFITLVDDEEVFSTNEAMAYGHGKNAEVMELHDISSLLEKK